jgi:hypothetical protein
MEGFCYMLILETQQRVYELFSSSAAERMVWVDAFSAIAQVRKKFVGESKNNEVEPTFDVESAAKGRALESGRRASTG